ncbi:MFS transporter [Falsiroseomonas sp. E2-1-a20]|uniref:MFS transporter n=1 Tax=Falsiroseomonas sp. E2-1-a20 TaxID=3239300 RepID=UPI003F3A0EF5
MVDDARPPTGPVATRAGLDQRWLALAVLTTARVSMGFQFQSIASVAPLIIEDLGLSYAALGTLIGLYMLPGIALSLPGALIGRLYGDKRTVALGLVLMAAGGILAGLAEGHAVLLTGRLISGAGAIVLTVLMTKMVTDWFAGCEIVLAMAIFINSFPIGIGLAMMSLGLVARGGGWRLAMFATTVLALLSLLLFLVAYRRHPNDGRGPASTKKMGDGINRRELRLVCIAGTIWGTFNGTFAIMLGFSPILLVTSGMTVVQAGLVVGTAGWLVVASVQAGGILAQRGGRATALVLMGLFGWGLCLLLMPLIAPAPPLLIAGLMMGLPVGVLLSLPSEVLRPESRGVGMGVFQTCNFAIFAALPALAGRLQDLIGNPATPFYVATASTMAMVLGYGLFRAVQVRQRS